MLFQLTILQLSSFEDAKDADNSLIEARGKDISIFLIFLFLSIFNFLRCAVVWAAVFTFNPYLLISINELMISIIHLLISINELLISINELLISINELFISINTSSSTVFIDINNSFIDINKGIIDITNSFIDINKYG